MSSTNENFHHYNKNLRENARQLRNNSTKSESCLWKYVLRAKMMKGYAFRRQRPVLKYIADFMCKELMLIIEVDGITHSWEETIKKDIHRQKELEAAGFRVLRIDDEIVLKHINVAREMIIEAIEQIESSKGI